MRAVHKVVSLAASSLYHRSRDLSFSSKLCMANVLYAQRDSAPSRYFSRKEVTVLMSSRRSSIPSPIAVRTCGLALVLLTNCDGTRNTSAGRGLFYSSWLYRATKARGIWFPASQIMIRLAESLGYTCRTYDDE